MPIEIETPFDWIMEGKMEDDDDEQEYGCEYCQNDGKLNEGSQCPKCDAWYPDEDGGA